MTNKQEQGLSWLWLILHYSLDYLAMKKFLRNLSKSFNLPGPYFHLL